MQRMIALGVLGLVGLAAAATGQNRFATSVVSYTRGSGGGIFVQSNALGAPQGGGLTLGSLDVLTLGAGGQVTLGFGVTIVDGPGADFTVFENPFAVIGGSGIFAEYAHVEVSTDGLTFARFPWRRTAGGTGWGTGPGLAGGTPCLANALTNQISPFDPTVSGGDAFDLAELQDDPAVRAGVVNLAAIHFVRLIDLSGADIDAVSVIQHAGNQTPGAPVCDLWRDAAGHIHWRLGDPNGLGDLDLARLQASINLIPVPVTQLLGVMAPVRVSGTEVELVTVFSTLSFNLQAVLAVSAADSTHAFSGDQISLNR